MQTTIATTGIAHAYPSVTAVVGFATLWASIAWLSPATLDWIQHAYGRGEEGPVEYFQHALLVVCGLSWAVIVWRVRSNRLSRLLAAAMVVQLMVLVGEEVDWGHHCVTRNIRMGLRDAGVIPYFMDAPTLTGYLLFFLLSPLIAIRRFQAWWAGAAPVVARRSDAAAVLLSPLLYLAVWAVVGEQQPTDLLQSMGYVVVFVVTVRIFREAYAR